MDQHVAKAPPTGLDAIWDSAVGLGGRLTPRTRRYGCMAKDVLALEEEFSSAATSKLRQEVEDLRAVFRRNRDTTAELCRAFALLREVASRQIGERPFGVQLTGAFALHYGCVAEMATGEGKTLTASLPTTIAGWRGRGCHVITVNDYLAQRDAEWMAAIYRFCGLHVAFIEQSMSPEDRRRAYSADITYCTNKEVAADYLRDRLAMGRIKNLSSALLSRIAGTGPRAAQRVVQRGLEWAIVDEADSILVDEAVTPLIISGQAPNNEQIVCYRQAAEIAAQLEAETDYNLNLRYREIALTERGKARVAAMAGHLGGLWKGSRRGEEMVTQALSAKDLFHRDKHYVVENDKVVIVDEFTGRLMPDRSWRDGLHPAVEAKEAVTINPSKDTYARISFQRFFRMYRKLAGMTGTAKEARREFWQIYHLPVAVIPTNRPCRRVNLPPMVFADDGDKWRAVVREISEIHAAGRPVLVGTRSVRASEYLSGLLAAEGLPHQVLNAMHHREEAQIVAQAGQPGKVTVATNMAGRGTDIKLGRGVAAAGGLHVISAEPNESARIDRQLFGRCARQGDPGSAQAIISLDDEFVSRYCTTAVKMLRKRWGSSRHDISSFLVRSVFHRAQGRAEAAALRQRKTVMKTDHWLDEQLGFAGIE
ncbi:MAG: preprotein translocase subunit SecA [Phycisphaerae bacterium]|nr:preprotein translocase subunit SecA [Phycisphaerae bacterium]